MLIFMMLFADAVSFTRYVTSLPLYGCCVFADAGLMIFSPGTVTAAARRAAYIPCWRDFCRWRSAATLCCEFYAARGAMLILR